MIKTKITLLFVIKIRTTNMTKTAKTSEMHLFHFSFILEKNVANTNNDREHGIVNYKIQSGCILHKKFKISLTGFVFNELILY